MFIKMDRKGEGSGTAEDARLSHLQVTWGRRGTGGRKVV